MAVPGTGFNVPVTTVFVSAPAVCPSGGLHQRCGEAQGEKNRFHDKPFKCGVCPASGRQDSLQILAIEQARLLSVTHQVWS